ncbi:MAG: hypothetical protein GYB24_07840 [Rhodobacteraceae bacterium]|nr:hypothetical protein [Paracoccaceae bacterium]
MAHQDQINRLNMDCIANGPEIPQLTRQPDESAGTSAMTDSARILGLNLRQGKVPVFPCH